MDKLKKKKIIKKLGKEKIVDLYLILFNNFFFILLFNLYFFLLRYELQSFILRYTKRKLQI